MKLAARPARASRSLRASGDRWLFGYADVVTLLFACFAALYASQIPVPVASAREVHADVVVRSQLIRDIAALAVAHDDIQMDLTDGDAGTVISLAEAGSFAPASADLTPAATKAIADLATLLRDAPYRIRVEGHTDDRPIRSAAFPSNWELSTARATRVVQFLMEQGKLAPDRLSAAGYSEYRPRVPNDSTANRARNRRVDIVVMDGVQEGASRADYRGAGFGPALGR